MEDAAETPKPYDGVALKKEGGQWMERIRAAEKREEDWRKDAAEAEKAFANDIKESGCLYDFNILHSNVETIVPAIYNSTPIPDVRRRFIEAIGEPPQDPTPQILQQAAQQMGLSPEQAQQAMQSPQGQQMAQQAMQSQQARMMLAKYQQELQAHQAKAQRDEDAKAFGDMIEQAITVQIDDNRLDIEIEREAQDSFLSGRGIVRVKFDASFEGDVVSNEHFEFEAVSWRDFRMGPAKRWDKVPWEAFRHTASRETLEAKVIDPEIEASQRGVADIPTTGPENDEDDIPYWEIWCKETRKVYFIREHDGHILKIVDDPLGLKGFFPNPAPVQPITLTGKMTPVCPFTIYRKLADELDTITKRINKIMEGLKVRGIIAGDASALVALAEAGDNEIRVETNLEGLAQTGGLEKAIMWWPVEQAVKVLKELYAQREIVKASIYEITGISDIVRGASQPSETATAQQIKTQWGALRIQKMQRMIERQVRDLFGMMAELIASKFSPDTLYQMTGIEVTPGMQEFMQQPTLTGYRIDVESDSTVRADLTRQKQDMSDFITGSANFFKTMAPLMADSPEAAGPIIDIYASMASVFKLGRQAEDALEKLGDIAKQAASKPRPNPEAEAARMEQEGKERDRQAEAQMKEREFQMKDKAEERKEQRATAADQRKLAFEERQAAIEERIKLTDLKIKEIDLQMKEREASLNLQTKQAENAIRLQGAVDQAEVRAAQGEHQISAAKEMSEIKSAQARKPKAKAGA